MITILSDCKRNDEEFKMAGDYLKHVERVRIEMDFMKKTAGQKSGNFSDSNSSPCLKKLCSEKLPQFHDMLNEICFQAKFLIMANG